MATWPKNVKRQLTLAIPLAEWHHIWQRTHSSLLTAVSFRPHFPPTTQLHPFGLEVWKWNIHQTYIRILESEALWSIWAPSDQTEGIQQAKKQAALTVSCPERPRGRKENEKHGEASVSDVCRCSSRSCLNTERHSRLFFMVEKHVFAWLPSGFDESLASGDEKLNLFFFFYWPEFGWVTQPREFESPSHLPRVCREPWTTHALSDSFSLQELLWQVTDSFIHRSAS